jgi:undecaprenyl-diphosphatase
VAAGVSGFVVIWFLLRYLRTHDFLIFMLFRFAVAALVIVLVATGVRSATI